MLWLNDGKSATEEMVHSTPYCEYVNINKGKTAWATSRGVAGVQLRLKLALPLLPVFPKALLLGTLVVHSWHHFFLSANSARFGFAKTALRKGASPN